MTKNCQRSRFIGRCRSAVARPLHISICLLVAVIALSMAPSIVAAQNTATKPRLILQITVDQLRGDLPTRYYDRFGSRGFRYLLDKGTVFASAYHAHANTETIVGHTTLATGAYPAAHGMVANTWFDRAKGREVYNIEDPQYHLLSSGAGVDKSTEIDPTQKIAKVDGRSPAAILVTTFSDELAITTAGQAKIFGVSVKDRGAVSMAGHAGKAFWFSKATGEWVTSNYYYDSYPAWVAQLNSKRPTLQYVGTSWELLHNRSTYLFGDADDRPWEMNFTINKATGEFYGRVFPHSYGPGDGKYFTTLLTVSPAGDAMTLEFSKALIENEGLGKDDIPDYLSISFSSTDYVGHFFGPSSLETEDNLLRLDGVLADLFAYVDKTVGLRNTLIVLSSDHGGPEAPAYLNTFGIPAGYIKPSNWDTQPALAALKKKFGIDKELIEGYANPYLSLNRKVIEEKGLDMATVESAVADELVKLPGVALAISSTALSYGRVPDTAISRAVLNNFNPKRSGDIFVVFEPQWFLNDFDGLEVAVTHGSPWAYDTFVPIIFAGANVAAQTVYRKVLTVDVAPTLAAFVGTKPPSGADGVPLVEVLAPIVSR